MSARRSAKTTDVETVNEVRLVGRLSQAPEERILPSGDAVWTFRVVVPRLSRPSSPPGPMSGGDPPRKPRQQVDALECAAWSPRARRSVGSWQADDVVEVVGALHRRFFRAAGAVASRVEVEMRSGRVIRRAARG